MSLPRELFAQRIAVQLCSKYILMRVLGEHPRRRRRHTRLRVRTGCSPGKRRSYPLHARRAAAARRAGGAHGWPRVFKLARNGDETAVCRRPKAVNACLLRPHPSSYTHGSIHRKQRLHIWPQCRAHSISWHVAIASLTLVSHAVAGFEQTQRCLPVYIVHIHKP